MATTGGNAEKRAERILLFQQGVQRCSTCREIKPLASFGKCKSDRLGYTVRCLVCSNLSAEAYREGRGKGRKLPSPHQIIEGVESKYCSKCGSWHPLNFFHKDSGSWDGLTSLCRVCAGIETAKWRQDNKGRALRAVQTWRRNMTEEQKQKNRDWSSRYYCREREKILCRGRERDRREREVPMNRINESISGALWKSLRGSKGGRHWEDLVGWTLSELLVRLESLFQEGMSWDNYGRLAGGYDNSWEIDHTTPKSHFSFSSVDDKDFKKCWALSNLQPKWAKENRQKGNRFVG